LRWNQNLIKPKGLDSIVGTGIVAKLKSLSEKKIGVSFTHAGIIGPHIGLRKIKALTKIRKEQRGWLEITFLNKDLRICRGDKGTLFILRKIKNEILFERFQEFIRSIWIFFYFLIQIYFKKKNIGTYLKDSLGISYEMNFNNSSIQ